MTFCGDLPFVPSGIHHHLFENLRRKGHHCHGLTHLSWAERKIFYRVLGGEPVTAEVLAQRQAEEAIRRETERRADEIVRKMAENKPDLPDGKTEQAVREIAGQERDRADITEREAALPESVLRESQREQEAVREVARENLLQERLQQIERDMVRDLQKEKTLGGD